MRKRLYFAFFEDKRGGIFVAPLVLFIVGVAQKGGAKMCAGDGKIKKWGCILPFFLIFTSRRHTFKGTAGGLINVLSEHMFTNLCSLQIWEG